MLKDKGVGWEMEEGTGWGRLCPEKDVCWPSSQVGTATPTVLEAS
jgi:hypothetical protein